MHPHATPGRWTLTTTGVPSGRRGGVHLGDGGGGERCAFDRGEGSGERAAELVGQDLLDDRPRLGGDLVAAPLELGDQLGGKTPSPDAMIWPSLM